MTFRRTKKFIKNNIVSPFLVRYKNHKALTLMELVVSISLFAVLTLVATRIYTRIADLQERNRDLQNIEGDLRYAMGVFADEVKGAQLHPAGGDDDCGGAGCADEYFCIDSGVLYLRDKNNLCVSYSLSGTNLVVNRGGTSYTITSDDVSIGVLNFTASAIGDRVLVQLRASGSTDYNKAINYQTAITSTTLR